MYSGISVVFIDSLKDTKENADLSLYNKIKREIEFSKLPFYLA